MKVPERAIMAAATTLILNPDHNVVYRRQWRKQNNTSSDYTL